MKWRAACAAFLLCAPPAQAQSITTEVALSTGYSSDEVSAGAVQLRAFGDLAGGVRYFGELAWANTSDPGSHAFGAAYPYTNQVDIIEAYGERMFRPGNALFSVRAGRFRTPFGISSASDHAYSGFLRAPLIRYDAEVALSNNFLEHGVDFVGGIPHATVEVSLGAPGDVGPEVRRTGLDAVMRVQGYYGPFIVGVSHSRMSAAGPEEETPGRSQYTGVDVRWMHDGVQLRGEWLTGQPFEGSNTRGWYADLLLHRTIMGPVTFVGRIEQLDVDGEDKEYNMAVRRQTIGARIRLRDRLSLNLNVLHRSDAGDEYHPVALDVGLTWSVRHR